MITGIQCFGCGSAFECGSGSRRYKISLHGRKKLLEASVSYRYPDLHSECGSGSRRPKMSLKRKKLSRKTSRRKKQSNLLRIKINLTFNLSLKKN
jgi:hypothetical protein